MRVRWDVIGVKPRKKSTELVQANMSEFQRELPDFLVRVEGERPEGHIVRLPEAEDVSIPVEPNLIVELCSK